MAKEWTDEEVTAEIQNAVKIVAEDRLFKGLSAKLQSTANPSGNNPATPPNAPPSGGDPNKPKKKGLFWGEEQ